MLSNIDKFKTDLSKLINKGELLELDIIKKYHPDYTKITIDPKNKKLFESLPDFDNEYQLWYSEALEIIKQLLPSRLDDFKLYYKADKQIKNLTCSTYTISDCLNGLSVTDRWGREIVGPDSAIVKFRQQVNILKSLERKFESSLFDVKQIIQADLFDSDLEASEELIKKGFVRGAGAIAGVVLESHLFNVLSKHNIKIIKKDPSISDLNDSLKNNNIIDLINWRFIQQLADLRNLCDHKKPIEPKKEDINELIIGVKKITKTIF